MLKQKKLKCFDQIFPRFLRAISFHFRNILIGTRTKPNQVNEISKER